MGRKRTAKERAEGNIFCRLALTIKYSGLATVPTTSNGVIDPLRKSPYFS
jgi:hypothetical protein